MQLPPPNEDFARIKGAHVLWRDESLAKLAGVDVPEAALDDLLLDEIGCMSQPHVHKPMARPSRAFGPTIMDAPRYSPHASARWTSKVSASNMAAAQSAASTKPD